MAECVPISRAGYVITKPGLYCFTQDIDTRLDFADHDAESWIVDIRASNVTVDMKGHRGGRGKFFVQHGGNGIHIDTNTPSDLKAPTHIVLKNGVLTDFDSGVSYWDYRYQMNSTERSLEELTPGEFLYRPADIRISNVVFKNCTKDLHFVDWVPADYPSPPPSPWP